MKPIFKLFILIFFLFILPSALFAQACVGGQDPGCSPDDDCPCPIDNGVLMLIGVVVALAAKKAYDFRKKANMQF